MAALWRSTCGETRLALSEGQRDRAIARCLAKRYSSPSRLNGESWALGKTTSEGWPLRSGSHWRRAATASLRKGVQRSLRLWKAFHNQNYAKVVVMQRYSAETCKKRVPRVLNLT